MVKKQFNIKQRIQSFVFALQGIRHVLVSQHNAWIHLMALILVTACGLYFDISNTEWLFVVVAIGFVFMAEAFNTAIELLVDKIAPEQNKKAGLIKDVAAGSVLIAAATALAIGLIVFLPKIL